MEHALLGEASPTPHLSLHETPDGEGDSSSGGSDPALNATPDPVSAQLINNITMLDYRSLGNSSPLILNEEELRKSEGVSAISTRQLPHFVSWNWSLIRSVLFWGVLSGVLACLAAVVAFVASLPSSCNPDLPWYQGTLFYEIFPASFQDTNGDGVGDLKGIYSRVEYMDRLGVKAVRLNSIFRSDHYPERYREVASLLDIEPRIGSVHDLAALIAALHKRNMTLILDLPIYPYVGSLHSAGEEESHVSVSVKAGNRTDRVVQAIQYWVSNGVDGFYLKGAEFLTNDTHFLACLKRWKATVGTDRILIVSYETLQSTASPQQGELLRNVDLVDVYLDVSNGSARLKEQVEEVMRSEVWAAGENPWIHWNVGSVETRRLSSSLSPNHTTAALLFNMMLPGSPSIFYGDEVALKELSEPEQDFHESKQIHNLIPMSWGPDQREFTSKSVLAWIQGSGRAGQEGQEKVIADLAHVRHLVPPIYANAVWRDGVGLPNAQVRIVKGILVVERWYPRRNSYVLVINMADEAVQGDLSTWLYGGTAVVSTNRRLQGKEFMFKSLALDPAQVVLIKMDK